MVVSSSVMGLVLALGQTAEIQHELEELRAALAQRQADLAGRTVPLPTGLKRTGGKLDLALTHDAATVRGSTFSPDGKQIATAAWDGTVRLWDAASGKELKRMVGDKRNSCVVFSPDGKHIAVGTATGRLRVWEVGTGKEVVSARADDGHVYAIAFAPDGKSIATAHQDAAVHFWDPQTGKDRLRVSGHRGRVWGVAFSPDGQRFATAGDDREAIVWEAGRGREVTRLRDARSAVAAICYSPDGRFLAAGEQAGSVRVHDASTGLVVRRFGAADETIGAVVFSPDTRLVATGTKEGVVRLWERLSGRELFRLDQAGESVHSLQFSPDGRRLLVSGADRTARTWVVRAAEKPGKGKLDDEWKRLADADPLAALDAADRLAAHAGDAVAFLSDKLKPTIADVETRKKRDARVKALVEDLTGRDEARREKAVEEIIKGGAEARPALEAVLADKATPVATRRLVFQVVALMGDQPRPEETRPARAVAVLEAVATPEARNLLRELTKGDPAAPATREAQSALDRMPRLADKR